MTLSFPIGTLFAFLLVLTRVAGTLAFIPGAMLRAAAAPARVVLALSITCSLFPAWPDLPDALPSIGRLIGWVFAEAGFGLAAGAAVGFLMETLQVAMQLVGLQAGYGYSQTIDPTSQADSGVLRVLFMLIGGMLFFTLGVDREVLRILGASLERYPAGSWFPSAASLEAVLTLGGVMFSTGLRLALPVVALLLLLDIAMALLGRMQQQLQLLSLAFPIKMLAALAFLALMAPMLPRFYQSVSQRIVSALWRLLAP